MKRQQGTSADGWAFHHAVLLPCLTSLLDRFTGILQSGAYETFAQNDGVIAIGCMAYAHRKFVNALQTAPREASLVLNLIGKL